MDQSTKSLVKESWSKVVPISDQAAELFYGRLFELDPDLKLIFKSPIPVQGKLLMKALNGAVEGLDDLDTLVPVLQALGARHAPYGVVESDYATVGSAFLWTLEQGLGDEFTPEVKAAWTEVYGVISDVMIAAQKEVELPGPVSPREKRIVQGSWALVEPISEKAASIFYARLFELDPSLKEMFPSDMTEQGKKLMQILSVAVKGLDRLDDIVPTVEKLGQRHVEYGVKDAHYDTVAAALLYTLQQGLGETYSDQVKEAWVTVYTVLADTMKGAPAASETKDPGVPAPSTPHSASSDGAQPGMIALMLFLCLVIILGVL